MRGFSADRLANNNFSAATAAVTHTVLPHAPHIEQTSMLLGTTAHEMVSTVQQLLWARKALVENNSSAARNLLEAAETSLVFSPSLERAGIAAAQITEALSMLNSGDAIRAVPSVNRAITAIQSIL